MMDRYLISAALLVLIFTISVGYSIPGDAYKAQSCGVSGTEMFELSSLPSIASNIIEHEFNEARGHLAQGKCSDLKPDYCGMGACKDGWTCKANVNSCMCFPPN